MAQRLTTAMCLAVAISAAFGSASLAAMSPPPFSLIGAAVPTQDEEADDEFADDSADDEAMAETEDTSSDAEDVPADEAFDEEAAAEPEPSEELPQDEPELAPEQEPPDTTMPEDGAETPEPPSPDPPAPPTTPPAPVPVTPEGRSASSGEEREDTTIYKVVINHEEQYSIWPANRENPLGWNDAGKTGNKQECLDYIKEVWTDMRPISLRKKMEEMERQRQNGGQ